jgi:hypothetical protein
MERDIVGRHLKLHADGDQERTVPDDIRLADQSSDMNELQARGQNGSVAGPLASALRRGERVRQRLLAAQGDLLDAASVATRLGTSLADVTERQDRGLLLGLPLDDGTLGFPTWQFVESGLLPGLDVAFRDIGVRDPWMQAAYFLSGDARLDGQTPLDMLRRGEIEAVRRAAAAYGEQLAS